MPRAAGSGAGSGCASRCSATSRRTGVCTEDVPPPRPRVLPPEYRGRPHDYLESLNFGKLPYISRSAQPSPSSTFAATSLIIASLLVGA